MVGRWACAVYSSRRSPYTRITPLNPRLAVPISHLPLSAFLAKFRVMQITALVRSHCDDTHTAFRTEPPLTQEVLDCAVTHFFPAGLGDMLSTRDGLLVVARVGIPSGTVQDYARYLTSAEMKVRKQQATDGTKRQVSLQDRANESGLPLE
jgi:hypothetical protein